MDYTVTNKKRLYNNPNKFINYMFQRLILYSAHLAPKKYNFHCLDKIMRN